MSNYTYVAVDPGGLEMRGTIEVSDQTEALRRIREMGLFPTKLVSGGARRNRPVLLLSKALHRKTAISVRWFRGGIRPAVLAIFTRQLATLLEAGMPLLRSLHLLQEQTANRRLKATTASLAQGIENGDSFAEALLAHPRIFDQLYVNMVRAGEISGALELTLKRLAEFMEKAQKIKGKVKAALVYPCAVLVVAFAIMALLMVFVVPKFKGVFDGLLGGIAMPAFTVFVFKLSEAVKNHALITGGVIAGLGLSFGAVLRTKWGRSIFDRFKLAMPVLGPVFRQAAIGRFSRTLATLAGSGVPILQALTIVKETAGNVLIANVIARVHENVKQGEPIAPTLKCSGIFPVMVAGMVDVGEQTGALPEMLAKIADNCDEEVENAANAMTSLLEPLMIVFLAVIVGSIVIAMFLPLIQIIEGIDGSVGERGSGARAD